MPLTFTYPTKKETYQLINFLFCKNLILSQIISMIIVIKILNMKMFIISP